MLRSIAMYLGIILHSCIVYQTTPRSGWPRDSFNSVVFDLFYFITHSFRMQLFYVVAGFFANLLLNKIGTTEFIKHRFKRVFLPFVISIIVITPFSSLAFNYYSATEQGIESFNSWSIAFNKALGWNGLYHLWFLYYLLIFYVVIIFVKELLKDSKYSLSAFKLNYSLGTSFVYVAILFLISYFFYDLKIEPWTGLKPRLNQFLYYGFFFGIGFFLFNNSDQLWKDAENFGIYLIIGVISTLSLVFFSEEILTISRGLFIGLMSMQTVYLTFGSLAVFLKFCEKNSRWVSYFSDASYWFYLLHFPLVTLCQVWLIDIDVYGPFKFLIVLSSSSLISLVTYQFSVRYTYIGVLLNGRRLKPNKVIQPK